MSEKKNLLVTAGKWMVGVAAVTAVVTALVTGQSLAGLTKLTVVWHALAFGSVPAWTLFLSLLLIICGIGYVRVHPPARSSRGRVHFVPDSHNCGWAATADGRMSLTLGGTLTYEGGGALTILKAFLKGTQPVTDMMAQVTGWDPAQWESTREIYLEGHSARGVLVQMYLVPSVGTPGQALRKLLVLRDKYNRDFIVGPIEFQYRGRH